MKIYKFINYCDDMMIAEESISAILGLSLTTAAVFSVGYVSKELIDKLKSKSKDRKEKKKSENEIKKLENIHDERYKHLLPLIKKMQKDCISHLKKYSNSERFKKKYKLYKSLINIGISETNDDFISVTEYEYGIDFSDAIDWEEKHCKEYASKEELEKANPYTKNEWYEELLNEGSNYLNRKYHKELNENNIKVYVDSSSWKEICISIV